MENELWWFSWNWKEGLPDNVAKTIEEYFTTHNQAKCPVCQQNIPAKELARHLVYCADRLDKFYGNPGFNLESLFPSSEGKKRKLEKVKNDNEEEEELTKITFPLPPGYYDDAPMQGICDFRECDVKNCEHHVERSVYVFCGYKPLQFIQKK